MAMTSGLTAQRSFAHGLWILPECLEMQSQEEEKCRASEGKAVAAKSLEGCSRMMRLRQKHEELPWKAESITGETQGLQITE